ncbi:MAG: hypothetical protein ACOYND_09935 [Bacteroidota bacterium]
MESDINEDVKKILQGESKYYVSRIYTLKHSSKDYYDKEKLSLFYNVLKALAFVAKKYYRPDFDYLMKNISFLFWFPDLDISEPDFFENGLLEVMANCKKHIREKKFDKTGLTPENYMGVYKIEYDISTHEYFIEYLSKVYDYVNVYEWRIEDLININVYEHQFDTLPIIRELSSKDIFLEDIIEDINRQKSGFYAIALMWKLGIINRLQTDQAKSSDHALSLIIQKWFSSGAKIKANSIEKYLGYLRKRGELTTKGLNSSYETAIADIEKKYKLASIPY